MNPVNKLIEKFLSVNNLVYKDKWNSVDNQKKFSELFKRKSGGSNTNKNGLFYENETSLEDMYEIETKTNTHNVVVMKGVKLVHTPQNLFRRYTKGKYNPYIHECHGTKNPDDCFIDEDNKKIYWIEKKYQQVGGSVCEKLQGVGCKVRNLEQRYRDYKIIYILWLTDWYKENCKGELEYLSYINIPVIWASDPECKNKIVDIITSR